MITERIRAVERYYTFGVFNAYQREDRESRVMAHLKTMTDDGWTLEHVAKMAVQTKNWTEGAGTAYARTAGGTAAAVEYSFFWIRELPASGAAEPPTASNIDRPDS